MKLGQSTSNPPSTGVATAAVGKAVWRPNDTVHVMAVSRTKLFLGGEFTRIRNTATGERVQPMRVAALNRDTNALVRSFHARVKGTVRALAVFRGKLVLGGDFTRVNGFNRQHLAALRLSDGRVIRSWHKQVNGPVLALYGNDPRDVPG